MNENIRQAFLFPDSEFTPVPFWFWNDALQETEIKRQMEDFLDKGVHAFVIHPRIGIPEELKYMSESWLDLVAFAVREAAQLDMKVVLYDEGMYPSGSAHGEVAKVNPDFRSRGLRRASAQESLQPGDCVLHEQDGIRYVEGFTNGTIRGIHFGEDDGEPGAPPSTDLLNPEAIRTFIALTHDKYYAALKEHFGTTIIGMFTDEPGIMGRGAKRGSIPWGRGFFEYFQSFGGSASDLPMLWEKGDERAVYEKAVHARLGETYYEPISRWCEEKGIALMGHPEKSDDIAPQKYFHIPGQDVVLRFVAPENETALTGAHSTQAKCSADAARHAGKRRNSNECFGACNRDKIPWNFTGADMKWYIDWLCVRGVNMLIPHAFYYSIDGQRKFERPPDVGPNNIWWDEYRTISDYIKRLCWLMTDSVNSARIAVLCGDDGLDWLETAELYRNQVEFNYLEQMYLQETNIADGGICVGQNRYEILLVPSGMELAEETRALLNACGIAIVNTAEQALKLVKREVRCSGFQPELRFSHVQKGGINYYVFVNEGENEIDTAVTVYRRGGCELWHPFEGTFEAAEVVDISEEFICVNLRLKRRESLILVLDESKDAAIFATTRKSVALAHVVDGRFTVTGEQANCKALLTLSDEYEYVQLYVNGHSAGVRMWAPFEFDITNYVIQGVNTVTISAKDCKAYEYNGSLVRPAIDETASVEFYQDFLG